MLGGLGMLLAGSRFSYDAGVSGTVTVPAGKQVIGMSCLSIGGGSFTVAPGGANQPSPPTAGPSVPLPAGVAFDLSNSSILSQLGGGTVFTFTGTDTYMVAYAESRTG